MQYTSIIKLDLYCSSERPPTRRSLYFACQTKYKKGKNKMTRNLRIGLLTMGSAAALAAPVALAVSCGGDSGNGNSDTTFDVGMEAAYAPYNFLITPDQYNSIVKGHPEYEAMVAPAEDGLYAGGYDVYMANLVGEELGLPVLVHPTEWDSLIPDIENGSIDAIIAGMSSNPERDERVDFSNAYFNPLNGFLYRSDLITTAPTINDIVNTTTNIKIAVQTGTLWEEIITEIAKTNSHITVVDRDDANLAELELHNGNVNYVFCENTRATTSIATHPNWHMSFVEGVSHDAANPEVDNIAVALPEDSTQMTQINNAVAGFTNRTEVLEDASALAVAITE